MVSVRSKIVVRYSETDKMGYVYYGNYASYYEVGRVDLMKSIGISYAELENKGIGLPVINYKIEYKSPAYYDDKLTVVTSINEKPRAKICFNYTIFKEDNGKEILLNQGETTLIFMNLETKKVIRHPPKELVEIFNKNFD